MISLWNYKVGDILYENKFLGYKKYTLEKNKNKKWDIFYEYFSFFKE